jgi:peptide-methionine (S)-S-oxide reductase
VPLRSTEAEAPDLDGLFRAAVAALDAGDPVALDRILAAHPELATARLERPGAWLREEVGAALDDFFARPYLLWFVAEDPVRRGRLPPNAPELARAIVETARRAGSADLKEQLDPALRLVAWSWIARESGVQLGLLDVLLDAGASPERGPENALVNDNRAAAAHLLARGAPPSVAALAVLGRLDEAARLLPVTSERELGFGLALAALRGEAGAVRWLLRAGADPNRPSEDLYAHGTPLHHAVSSGSLDTVVALLEAGAERGRRDSAWNGTPLDWAEHLLASPATRDAEPYRAIRAALLAVVEGEPGPPGP